ncbi:MAG: hypothetical protein RIS08_483 [Actinomycetota bacterium]|jgi:hypothetical protein
MEEQRPVKFEIALDAAQEVGVFADYANIWNSPTTFVLDFLSMRLPARDLENEGEAPSALVSFKVAARIRIPAEQVFPLIEALKSQGDAWLKATGRSEPPESWFNQNMGNPGNPV